MRTMLLSDLMMTSNYLRRFFVLLVLCVAIASFLMRNTPLVIVFGGSITPLALLSTLVMYDDRNGWEAFRLALPLSRRNIVFGRYATLAVVCLTSTALCAFIYLTASVAIQYAPVLAQSAFRPEEFDSSAFTLCVASPLVFSFVLTGLILPLVARFGMTRSIRYILAAGMAGTTLLFNLRTMIDITPFMPLVRYLSSTVSTLEGALTLSGALLCISAAFYLASAHIASRMYRKREF